MNGDFKFGKFGKPDIRRRESLGEEGASVVFRNQSRQEGFRQRESLV
jgi:hypothetical protein